MTIDEKLKYAEHVIANMVAGGADCSDFCVHATDPMPCDAVAFICEDCPQFSTCLCAECTSKNCNFALKYPDVISTDERIDEHE